MAKTNLPQGYIPNKPLKDIEQDFKNGNFGSVDDFVSKDFTQETSAPASAVPVPTKQSILKSKSFQYLNDTGNGRISSGVLSLEAITKSLKGIPIHALTLFDQTIYTDPNIFKSTVQVELRLAVYTNLGIADYVAVVNSKAPGLVNTFNITVDNMIKDIKNMTFTYDNYIDIALASSKSIVKAALNFGGN